jgi:hypothetical protein
MYPKCCASTLNRNSAPGSIAAICTLGKATVRRYPQHLVEAAGLSWTLPADLHDVALERRRFSPSPVASPDKRCLPDWAAIYRKLKIGKKATLHLLWEKYKQAHPRDYAYRVPRPLPQMAAPVAGSSTASASCRGKRCGGSRGADGSVTGPRTDEVRQAEAFVAVLGVIRHSYTEAAWSNTCRASHP